MIRTMRVSHAHAYYIFRRSCGNGFNTDIDRSLLSFSRLCTHLSI